MKQKKHYQQDVNSDTIPQKSSHCFPCSQCNHLISYRDWTIMFGWDCFPVKPIVKKTSIGEGNITPSRKRNGQGFEFSTHISVYRHGQTDLY
uniref:Uncharacterized protein n=1 Tax=Arundo donax TaxID=35708 RepID=A0A0A8YBZ2_ARUDO